MRSTDWSICSSKYLEQAVTILQIKTRDHTIQGNTSWYQSQRLIHLAEVCFGKSLQNLYTSLWRGILALESLKECGSQKRPSTLEKSSLLRDIRFSEAQNALLTLEVHLVKTDGGV